MGEHWRREVLEPELLAEPEADHNDRLPAHIKAFRMLVVPTRDSEKQSTILATWRALLPGLAQLWYRCEQTWTSGWPFKLLRLLLPIPTDEKNNIAAGFLQCNTCCLGNEGSVASDLHHMAMELHATTEGRIGFLLGPWCTQVLTTWGIGLSTTIQDIECGNAKIKKAHKTGRPQHEATLGAKMLVSEAGNHFFQRQGKWPENRLRNALEILSERGRVSWDGDGTKKRKRRHAFELFRRDYNSTKRMLDGPLPLVSNPEYSLGVSRAYTNLSPEARRMYEDEAAIINDLRKQQGPLIEDDKTAIVPLQEATRFYAFEPTTGAVYL